jgi:hypothetical protein
VTAAVANSGPKKSSFQPLDSPAVFSTLEPLQKLEWLNWIGFRGSIYTGMTIINGDSVELGKRALNISDRKVQLGKD